MPNWKQVKKLQLHHSTHRCVTYIHDYIKKSMVDWVFIGYIHDYILHIIALTIFFLASSLTTDS